MKLEPQNPWQAQAIKNYNNYDALARYAPAIYLQFTKKVSKYDKNFKTNFVYAVKKAPHSALEHSQGEPLFTKKLQDFCKSMTSPV